MDPAGPHSRGAEYFAANPKQQLRAWFGKDGIELASGRPTPEGREPWRVKMKLRGVRRTGQESDTGRPRNGDAVQTAGDQPQVGHALSHSSPTITARNSRIEIAHPEGVTEWYENKSEGIEHGFTLTRRPAGEGGELDLFLEMKCGVHPAPDGVHFTDADGAEIVSYTGLKAWDANGRALDVRMEPRGSELALFVNDAGARYPVTIDPLFANIEVRLSEDSGEGDNLGAAVAVDGNTAMLGAPLDSTPTAVEGGSAYIFVNSSGVWRQQTKLTAADGASGDRFGESVALSGETALVGARGDDTTAGSDAGSAYVFVRSGTSWTEQVKFTAPNGGGGSSFGRAVAVSGETALVSAASHTQNPPVFLNTGVAYVFKRSGTTWSAQAQLTASDATSGDNFGSSVALSGDSALIGAIGDDTAAGEDAGSAYVFARIGTIWSEQAKLIASDGAAQDQFGSAVAISGNTVVVTALRNDTPVENAGSAYVFVRSGTTWSEQAKLTASDADFSDFFGRSVALSGDTTVVGAVGDDSLAGENAGSAYVFVRSGTTWSQQAKLTASDEAGNDQFGGSVALSGNTALVGASLNDALAGTDAGSSYVFTRNGTIWTQHAKLTAGDSADFDSFALDVALDGDTALVGTPLDDVAAAPDQGSVYIFVRTGNAWSQQAKITGIDAAAFRKFGRAVALNGNTALVGADQATKGRAYVFVRNGATWSQQAFLAASDAANGDSFAHSVALDGDTALVGALSDSTLAGTEAGSAYIFVRSGTTWSEQAKLVAADGLTNAQFGSAVALSGETALVGNNNQGAYAFVRSGTTWSQQTKFTASEPTAVGFGFSVALSGDTALIGAPGSSTVAGVNGGGAYVFTRSAALWSQQAKLTASDAQTGDVFGVSVALDGDTALIGACRDDLSEVDAGSAYIFTRSGTAWSQQVKLTSGPDASAGDLFGFSTALSGDTALVGAYDDDTSGKDGGSAYVFRIGQFPAITTQPGSRTVVPGVTVAFSVIATGYAPLLYQWRKNGFEISGANGPSYTIPVVQLTNAGVYDCIVSNIGGVATSAPATLAVNALSQFTQQVPPVVGVEARSGFLFVNLIPSGIWAGWRFVGEQSWRASGVPVGGLTTGDREVEYRPAAGYDQPLRETVSIVSGGAATFIEREYYEVAEPGGTGGMIILLRPESLTLPALPLEQRAQWRLLGEDDSAWRESGATLDGLRPGSYLVEAKPLAGRTTPPPLSVTVSEGNTSTAATTYFLADPITGTSPALLPYETVTSSPSLPYQYVGQLRSDAGAGSGFVVRQRVVATAAHVVFDDATLSAATGQQWLFQRDRVSHEPKPQLPRGAYLFTGYSARRSLENTPGTSSPESQTLDAAAVYFLEDAGRGGFAGYLASDSTPNEWLASPGLKTLVGYPVTGIAASNQGRMHATPPMNVAFTPAFGRTYTTANIRSSGGSSGGPLCVQFEGGAYYPAAIFLGGSGQTVVRVIDSDLMEMFNRAAISGTGGANNSTGGITHTSSPLSGGSSAGASLKVTLSNAGGKWRIGTAGTLQNSGVTLNSLTAGSRTLNFTAVSGFLTPPAFPVSLTSGNLTTVTVPYNGITGQPPNRTVPAFTSAAFSVTVAGTPTGYQWRRNSANIAGATARNYTRTNVTASAEGSYTCVVTWDNGSQTSAAGILTVLPVAQTTTFAPIADQPPGSPPLTLSATATSGLPVAFTVVSGPATLAGNVLTLTGTGAITVRAGQPGDANYDAAPDVDRTFSALGLTPAAWLAQTFTPAELANPAIGSLLADPDGDGIKNIFEFAFNLNPKAPSLATLQPGTGTSGLPYTARNGGGSLTIEFIRRRATAAPGITYAAEFTSDLAGPWTTATAETVSPIDSTFERVTLTDPATGPKRYTRVRVTTTP